MTDNDRRQRPDLHRGELSLPRRRRTRSPTTTSLLENGVIDSTGILELVAFLEEHFSHRRWPTRRSCRTISIRSRAIAAFVDAQDCAQRSRPDAATGAQRCASKNSCATAPAARRARRRWSPASTRLTFDDLDLASDRLAARARRERRRARRPRRRLHGQLLRRRWSRSSRSLKAGARLLPGQPVDQGGQARLHPQQLRGRGARHPAQAHRRVAADALAEAPSVALTIVAGGQARRRSPTPCTGATRSPREAAPPLTAASTSTSRCSSTPPARPASRRA